MPKLSVFLRNYSSILILVVVPLLIATIWFRYGLIKGGAEEGLMFYDPVRTLNHSLNLWWDVDGGFSNLAWLPQVTALLPAAFFFRFLGIPNFILQAATFFFVLATGGISVYLFLTHSLKKYQNKNVVAVVAGLFYIFNPYSISQIWSRSLTDQMFSFALLPLGSFLFWKGLEYKKKIYVIYFFLATIIFSTAFGVSTFIITFWSVITLVVVYWLILNRHNFKAVIFGMIYYLSSMALWLLGNAWWTFPTIFSGRVIYSGYLGNATENVSTLIGVSNYYTPDWLIRLLQKHYFVDSQPFGQVYSLLHLQIISWLIPLFLIIGIIAIIKREEFKNMYLWLAIFIVGLVVSLGANWPFGNLFIWIFEHNPVLQAFRNPYEKYGIVYALGYSALFALGLVELIQRPKYILNSILFFRFESKFKPRLRLKILIGGFFIILICGIYAWPMWVGLPISGPDWQVGVKVPDSYRGLNTLLNDRNSDRRRVFMTPLLEGEGAIYSWNGLLYNGADPMMFIMDSPIISSSPTIPYFYDFIRNIRDFFDQKPIADVLSLLRVGFLIDQADLQEVNEVSKKQFNQLTGHYYQPKSVGQQICPNLLPSNTDAPSPLICQLGKNEDFQQVKFLHLIVYSDQDANLDISLLDNLGQSRRWYAVIDSEYFLRGGGWEELIIPFDTPAVGYKLNFNNLTALSIGAHPKGLPNSWVNLLVKGIWLDTGTEVSVQAYRLIDSSDKLSLYQSVSSVMTPKIGTLEKIQVVENFNNLFNAASQNKDKLDKMGFALTLQNKKNNLGNLTSNLSLTNVQVQEYPGNIFWVKTQEEAPKYLILSENFHQGWKVLEGVDKQELDGSPLSLMRLLQKKYLPESSHYVINGYANLWKTTGNTNNYAILFLPQIWADLGKQLSIMFVTASLGVIIINMIKKRRDVD